MPDGKTHDLISLSVAPIAALTAYRITGAWDIAVSVTAGHLFSSFWLNPDLDLHSNPYKRWGWLRWIWLPYQKTLTHRSFWSHGFVVGTTGRCLYFAIALSLFAIAAFAAFIFISTTLEFVFPGAINWSSQQVQKILFVFAIIWNAVLDSTRLFVPGIDGILTAAGTGLSDWYSSGRWMNTAIAGFIGLEVGAACHYLADWISTWIKKTF